MVHPVALALQEYEQRLRDLGSAVVDRLQPGLTSEQIEALESEFGVRLPAGARAVWAWHDGVALLRQRGPFPTLLPYRVLPDLRSSLAMAAQIVATHNAIVDEPGMAHLRWDPNWVILTTDGKVSVVVDCTHYHRDLARTALFVAGEAIDSYIQLPLLERICWWNWALEHGAWVVTPDGGWSIDRTKYPTGPGLGNILV